MKPNLESPEGETLTDFLNRAKVSSKSDYNTLERAIRAYWNPQLCDENSFLEHVDALHDKLVERNRVLAATGISIEALRLVNAIKGMGVVAVQ